MIDIESGGQSYSIGRIDTFKQGHIVRRLGPVLLALVSGAQGGELTIERFAGPLLEALARMPDAEYEYIQNVCLACVKRRQGNSLAPILSRANTLMFDDIDLATVYELVIEAIKENLGDFFGKAVAKLGLAATTE